MRVVEFAKGVLGTSGQELRDDVGRWVGAGGASYHSTEFSTTDRGGCWVGGGEDSQSLDDALDVGFVIGVLQSEATSVFGSEEVCLSRSLRKVTYVSEGSN